MSAAVALGKEGVVEARRMPTKPLLPSGRVAP
jgi:hypothetical protein